jgi:acetyltransferase
VSHPDPAPRDPAVLDALFRPKAVAMVGASTQPEKLAYQVFKNLAEAGFGGPLYPVNPKADAILGRKAFPAVADLPEAVDLAVIMVPARVVPETIRACGRKGTRAAIVISGGFSETGPDGDRLQQEALAAAREAGIGLVGPNCQGVNHPYHGLCASWPLLTTRGCMAVISQSGTVGAALMDWASQEELGVSAFVSMGNRADLDESDLLEYFAADPNTRAIAFYLESIKSVPRFLRAMATCPKPVVILKAGRTPKGRIAAESHTRSLAGRDEIYEGAFRQYRIHRAATLDELYDAAKALAYLRRPAGKRIAIITSSGGSGILATDAAEMAGLDVAPLPETLRASLKPVLPPHCTVANPLDLTGDATAAMYRQVAEAAAPHFDSLVIIFGDPIPGASEVVPVGSPHAVICLGGADVEREERARMHRKGIPTFPTPERGVLALSHLTRF